MSKTAIVVSSDPQSGGDEALGRLFNAMFLPLEAAGRGGAKPRPRPHSGALS
jgi:hypothetical protein